MRKYKKKPVSVKCIQWTTENESEILRTYKNAMVLEKDQLYDDVLAIQTIEGLMFAKRGDYIIEGVKGEVYSCRKDIFEETYEPAEDLLEYAIRISVYYLLGGTISAMLIFIGSQL